jgi:hypothetical protein
MEWLIAGAIFQRPQGQLAASRPAVPADLE